MDDFTKGFLFCLLLSLINFIIKEIYHYYKVQKSIKEKGYHLEIKSNGKKFNSFEEFEDYEKIIKG